MANQSEDFYVEVLSTKGVWYRAHLIDFDNNGILVKFEQTSNSLPVRFSFMDSRLPPPANDSSPVTLKQGDDCEVLSSQSDNKDLEPSGWWPATVKMIKGGFFVVDYKIQEETKYSDIIPSDRIRQPNKNGPIQLDFLHKIILNVPDDLREM
jgi:hypothetical protein